MDSFSIEHKHAPRDVVRVLEEREGERGWTYRVVVRTGRGEREHVVTLSYRDHDHWCGGSMAPSLLLERLIEHVLRVRREELPERFDAARVRRWLPEIDRDFRGG
jgi:hypothetical protein